MNDKGMLRCSRATAVVVLILTFAIPAVVAYAKANKDKAKSGFWIVDAQGRDFGRLLKIGVVNVDSANTNTYFFAVIDVGGRLAAIGVNENGMQHGNFLDMPMGLDDPFSLWQPALFYSELNCTGVPWMVSTGALNVEQSIVFNGMAFLPEDPFSNEMGTVNSVLVEDGSTCNNLPGPYPTGGDLKRAVPVFDGTGFVPPFSLVLY